MSRRTQIACLLAVFFSICVEASLARQTIAPLDRAVLKQFLQQYLAGLTSSGSGAATDKTAQFAFAGAQLTSDPKAGEDVLVYVSGRDWCGTGGCILLVLESDGGSYKVIGRASIVRPPIRMLPSVTNGYHDLGVWVQGGGNRRGFEAALPFNGATYAANPTLAPAHRNFAPAGDTLIPADPRSQRLFE